MGPTGTPSRASLRRLLQDNLKSVRERMAEAAIRAGRDPAEVRLVAVTKYVDVQTIRALLELGHADIGESRVQELTRRAGMIAEALSRLAEAGGAGGHPMVAPRWHMVGHLQRNKVKALLPWVSVIHSVDSLRLAEELSNQLQKANRTLPIFLQVNASGEKTKFGVAVGAITHLAEQVVTLPGLQIVGLMTMAPLTDDEQVLRRTFARTRELFEEMREMRELRPHFRELSMGMSNDFEIAIEEGATVVRIGQALFQGLVTAGAHADTESDAHERG